MTALKRVRAWLETSLPELVRYEYERTRFALDIRAVVALAERNGEADWNAAIECCIDTMRRFGGIDGGTEKMLRQLLSNRAVLSPAKPRAKVRKGSK